MRLASVSVIFLKKKSETGDEAMRSLLLLHVLVSIAAILAASLRGTALRQPLRRRCCTAFAGRAAGIAPMASTLKPASGLTPQASSTAPQRGVALTSGQVLKLTTNKTKTEWTETVLYSFSAEGGCTDGAYPEAGLIMDTKGHLYGTTNYGGVDNGSGTVFELTPASGSTDGKGTPHLLCAG
jgi:uncharacterized repeat protein (TIGR03803 family)